MNVNTINELQQRATELQQRATELDQHFASMETILLLFGAILVCLVLLPFVPFLYEIFVGPIVYALFDRERNMMVLIAKLPNGVLVARYLFKATLLPDHEYEAIIGDLHEEFNQFNSKSKARVWVCKQIVWSILPLIYKGIVMRFTLWLRERTR